MHVIFSRLFRPMSILENNTSPKAEFYNCDIKNMFIFVKVQNIDLHGGVAYSWYHISTNQFGFRKNQPKIYIFIMILM